MTNIKQILATATLDELLGELQRRDVLKPCAGSMIVDGRARREAIKRRFEELGGTHPSLSADEAMRHADRDFMSFLELRLLEVMSRGLATAQLQDKVHVFSTEPAQGDLAPGSLSARVDLLAVSTQLKEAEAPDAAAN